MTPALIEGARVLGIETSCDETAAAVVQVTRGELRVLSNVVATQHAVHAQFSGVVPELASRAHLERLLPTLQRALTEAQSELGQMQAIAVGHRPGLIGSLLVGTAAAKALAWSRGLPLIGVDHVAAHWVAAYLNRPAPKWPAIGLVVSGGHTHLALLDGGGGAGGGAGGGGGARIIGRTIDDAVGEAFDKAAVTLGLGYPGGPRLDAASDGGNDRAMTFPMPVLTDRSTRRTTGTADAATGTAADADNRPELNFSFSGMKTALLYAVRGVPSRTRTPTSEPDALTPERVRDLAASFQRAAVEQVVRRTDRALGLHAVRTLIVGGGVVANRRLRAELLALGAKRDVEVLMPEPAFCVDNAAMIAGLAHERLARGESDPLWLAPSPRSALLAQLQRR